MNRPQLWLYTTGEALVALRAINQALHN